RPPRTPDALALRPGVRRGAWLRPRARAEHLPRRDLVPPARLLARSPVDQRPVAGARGAPAGRRRGGGEAAPVGDAAAARAAGLLGVRRPVLGPRPRRRPLLLERRAGDRPGGPGSRRQVPLT